MGTQIKDNPRNIANPEPNVAPLASPNVKLSAIGLYLLWDMGSLTDSFNQMILLKVRLPRIIEALLTGI
jgi:ABC-type enterobactin transport system permease subunit